MDMAFATAPDVAAEIGRWLAYLGAEKRMSPKTLDAYRRDVAQFLAAELAAMPQLNLVSDGNELPVFAVTTSAEVMLSIDRPCLRDSQPMPPPRVSPPTPVWLTVPTG